MDTIQILKHKTRLLAKALGNATLCAEVGFSQTTLYQRLDKGNFSVTEAEKIQELYVKTFNDG